MRKLTLFALMCAFPFLSSCNSGEEADDLAKAQQCLDQVPQSDPASASNCLQYVEKYSSQQANILKCSIYMTSGGLMENKVVQAAEAMQDSSNVTNKEAAYMSILALDVPDANAGYTKAVDGNVFCQASGIAGLQYIGGLVVAGSYMAKTMSLLGITLDINNPEAAVSQLIDTCTADLTQCASDLPTLGETVLTLAESYCGTEDSDDEICGDINSAVASSGADPSDIGRALFCFMETPARQYDPVNDVCL